MFSLGVILLMINGIDSCDLYVGFITDLSGINANFIKPIQASENIAINEINNDNSLLPNCTIIPSIVDSKSNVSNVIYGALRLLGQEIHDNDIVNNDILDANISTINVPFVMGAQLSSLSSYLNPILRTFNILQISASATSEALTPPQGLSPLLYFNRVVSSDALQSHGLLELCLYFNWTNIGVLYVNDPYGIYLFGDISTQASQIPGFQITGVSFDSGSNKSIKAGVEGIKTSNVWVTILIVHHSDIKSVVQNLKEADIFGYPYYYLGCDAWMDGNLPIDEGMYDIYGSIGTCPWTSDDSSKDLELYRGTPFESIYNDTVQLMTKFTQTWNKTKYENADLIYNLEKPGLFGAYGYDLMYLFAHAMTKYHSEYGIPNTREEYNIPQLRTILVETHFMGLTGNVSLNNRGNRINGLFAICNLVSKNEDERGYKYIGYITQTGTSPPKYTFHIDNSSVTWPHKFKGRHPLTNPATLCQIGVISRGLVYPFSLLSMILIIVAIVCGILIFIWRRKKVIKSASWRLCLLMSFGCILGYMTVIMFGLDEAYITENDLKWRCLCNTRIILAISAIVLTFGPLFAKTYRISKIFNTVLQKTVIPDSRLFIAIFTVYGIEILLFVALLLIGGEYREYTDADPETTDDILVREYTAFGACKLHNSSIGRVIYFAMTLIIILSFMYGLYFAITVINIRVRKFNEAIEIVVSIVISSTLMIVTMPLIVFIDAKSQTSVNLRYVAQAGYFMISTTVILFSIIVSRLIIICRGKEKEFEKADIKYLTDITNELQTQLQHDLDRIETKLYKEMKKSSLKLKQSDSQPSLVVSSRLITSKNSFIHKGKCDKDGANDISEDIIIRVQSTLQELTPVDTIDIDSPKSLAIIDDNSNNSSSSYQAIDTQN